MDKLLKGENMKIISLTLAIILTAPLAFAATVYEKASDNEIKVTAEITESKESVYDYGFLIQQKADIEKDKADYIAKRDKEITEINTLIAEAKKLGVTVKIVEEEAVLSEEVTK